MDKPNPIRVTSKPGGRLQVFSGKREIQNIKSIFIHPLTQNTPPVVTLTLQIDELDLLLKPERICVNLEVSDEWGDISNLTAKLESIDEDGST